MLENYKENGPYFVIAKGFAVPHSGIGKETLGTGMSLIKLKKPVMSGHLTNDPVSFVCCLCASDAKTHAPAFLDLVGRLQDPMFRKNLWKAETPKDLFGIMKAQGTPEGDPCHLEEEE
jgi:mannitol/fructose-specific phosphotransferase system IIA component (Ntr-type)